MSKEQKIRLTTKKRNPMRDWELYLFLAIPVAYVLIFRYLPMSGLLMAFKDYKVRLGLWKSPWADYYGLEYFIRFFKSYQCKRVIVNTLVLSFYTLIATFPIPILFALMLNSIRRQKFATVSQTIVTMPHFISVVVMVGIVMAIFNRNYGLYGNLSYMINGKYPPDIFASPSAFRHMYVWSEVWQSFGWSSIIYTAALSNVDPAYHEAAELDGASRLQRIIYVDLPTILPTIITMLILRLGHILNIGFEKVFLLQNTLNLATSQVISTYTYEIGLGSGGGNFSYATAIGMFNNIVQLILVLTVNKISQKLSDTSLW